MKELLLLSCSLAILLTLAVTAKPGTFMSQDVMWWKHDEYSNISFPQEKQRLKAFVKQLQAQKTSTAYIVVYAGRRSCKGEAQARAERVKKYLVRFGAINDRRIRTIDAGYKEEWTIELYSAASADPRLTSDFIKKTDSHLPTEQVHIVQCVNKFLGRY